MTAPLRVDGVPRRGQRSLRVANDGHRRRRIGPRLRDDRRLRRLRLGTSGPQRKGGSSLGLSLASRRRLCVDPSPVSAFLSRVPLSLRAGPPELILGVLRAFPELRESRLRLVEELDVFRGASVGGGGCGERLGSFRLSLLQRSLRVARLPLRRHAVPHRGVARVHRAPRLRLGALRGGLRGDGPRDSRGRRRLGRFGLILRGGGSGVSLRHLLGELRAFPRDSLDRLRRLG
mmetsp:Transcript_3164/g.14123  ORF Transcript_3164/g.14123 Transcript_3164/m.14123 type:complete len:232 (+) Transcript_3164:257-952(+)